jgi:hypothetical protein
VVRSQLIAQAQSGAYVKLEEAIRPLLKQAWETASHNQRGIHIHFFNPGAWAEA